MIMSPRIGTKIVETIEKEKMKLRESFIPSRTKTTTAHSINQNRSEELIQRTGIMKIRNIKMIFLLEGLIKDMGKIIDTATGAKETSTEGEITRETLIIGMTIVDQLETITMIIKEIRRGKVITTKTMTIGEIITGTKETMKGKAEGKRGVTEDTKMRETITTKKTTTKRRIIKEVDLEETITSIAEKNTKKRETKNKIELTTTSMIMRRSQTIAMEDRGTLSISTKSLIAKRIGVIMNLSNMEAEERRELTMKPITTNRS